MSVKYATIEELRQSIVDPISKAYKDRMFQPIPNLPTVKDRSAYLVEKAKDKVVLDVGCTGDISKKIKTVAKGYYGIDKVPGDWEIVDLDHKPHEIPKHADVDTVICSEVLEHLANPGFFLMALKQFYPGRTLYFTVPNAGAYMVKEGCEVVNAEHVCWYSYATLKTLLTRYKYEIVESRWYNGDPYKAEGLIMVAKG